MILNVGSRTDIVQHYGKWLINRFREGFVYTRNPLFPNRVTRYELSPDKIDAVLFCSKNYEPFLDGLKEIARSYRVYCHYTITAYGRDVEPNVPDLEQSMETLLKVEKIVGKNRLAWRYDPVLLTERYTVSRHFETFERMAKKLSGHIDRCIFSFVEMYIKLQKNMPELIPLTEENKKTLATGLAAIAKENGILLQACGNNGDFRRYGIANSGCVTLDILGKANGCSFRHIKHEGTRRGCQCIESRDVGWYNTCPNLCRYCYANNTAEQVIENMRQHDPDSPILIGHINATDSVLTGQQQSFLRNDGKQISLFD